MKKLQILVKTDKTKPKIDYKNILEEKISQLESQKKILKFRRIKKIKLKKSYKYWKLSDRR